MAQYCADPWPISFIYNSLWKLPFCLRFLLSNAVIYNCCETIHDAAELLLHSLLWYNYYNLNFFCKPSNFYFSILMYNFKRSKAVYLKSIYYLAFLYITTQINQDILISIHVQMTGDYWYIEFTSLSSSLKLIYHRQLFIRCPVCSKKR